MVKTNWLFWLFTFLYFTEVVVALLLEHVNRRHLKKHATKVPETLANHVDEERLEKITAYTIAKSRFGNIQKCLSALLVFGLLISGFFPWLACLLKEAGFGPVFNGVGFFLGIGAIGFLISLPFDFFYTFRLEQNYGFNQSTLKTWTIDQVKSVLLLAVLMSGLLGIVFWLISSTANWWLWVFLAVSAFQLGAAFLFPVLIAPLFNKFKPLENKRLEQDIKSLMSKAGIKIKSVLEMDASRRSSHTNAYFTGFGKTKRIVLYDTLVKSHSEEGLLAVLAHEAGHYQHGHIVKGLALAEFFLLMIIYTSWLVLENRLVYSTFGFENIFIPAGLFIISIFWQKAAFFIQPLGMALSRHFERQSDSFAVELTGKTRPLAETLKKFAAQNLSNLSPHPAYVWFHYSHPPLLKRVHRLEKMSVTSS